MRVRCCAGWLSVCCYYYYYYCARKWTHALAPYNAFGKHTLQQCSTLATLGRLKIGANMALPGCRRQPRLPYTLAARNTASAIVQPLTYIRRSGQHRRQGGNADRKRTRKYIRSSPPDKTGIRRGRAAAFVRRMTAARNQKKRAPPRAAVFSFLKRKAE